MDNYFDIVTPAELEEQYGYMPSAKEIAADRQYCEQDVDYNFQYLFWLFLERGDTKTANFYLDQIKDPQRHLDAVMLAYECKD